MTFEQKPASPKILLDSTVQYDFNKATNAISVTSKRQLKSLGTIAVVNLSSTDTDDSVRNWTIGVQSQCNQDVSQFWGYTADLSFVANATAQTAIPKADGYCVITKDADVAGAYGYHDVGPNNEPVVKVFTSDAEANGVPVSTILSHEICECIGDWNASTTIQGYDEQGKACLYYQEICDAGEALSYQKNNIAVSDFVTPFWFTPNSTKQMDFMNQIKKPFEILQGGYMAVSYDNGSSWDQINKGSKRAAMHQSPHSRYAVYKKKLDERIKSTFTVQ